MVCAMSNSALFSLCQRESGKKKNRELCVNMCEINLVI